MTALLMNVTKRKGVELGTQKNRMQEEAFA